MLPGSLHSALRILEMGRSRGLYSSHLPAWRLQRSEHALRGVTPKKRGCKWPIHFAHLPIRVMVRFVAMIYSPCPIEGAD